jgi:hypothetical protein
MEHQLTRLQLSTLLMSDNWTLGQVRGYQPANHLWEFSYLNRHAELVQPNADQIDNIFNRNTNYPRQPNKQYT